MDPYTPPDASILHATSPTELLARAATLAETFRIRAAEHDRAASFPMESFDALRAEGWPALVVPVDAGGLGAGLGITTRVVERFAEGDGSTALAVAMHFQTIGQARESGRWRADTAEEVFRACAAGAFINACATEPALGSPSRGGLPQTTAEALGHAWVIDGRKTFASMAPALDFFVIPAAIAGDDEAPIGRFLVPKAAGVRVVETWDPMAMRATGSHDIVLDRVQVPDTSLLVRESAAPPDRLRPRVNAWFTLLVSAAYLGVSAAALRDAARYAIERVPTALGKPIAGLEGIQRRLGEGDIGLRAARTLLEATADAWDAAPDDRPSLARDVVAAKIFCTNQALAITDAALRVVGGAAMRRDLPFERYYRDVRAGLVHPPDDDSAAALLGRGLLLDEGWEPSA